MTSQNSMLYVRDQGTRRYRRASPDEILTTAETVVTEIFNRETQIMSATDAKRLIWAKLANREAEVFCCMYLDNKHRLLAFEEMFRGTINCAPVYPREVAKRALQLNAAALIVCHHHPGSGNPEPSRADEVITLKLKQAMELLEIRLLDHVIVGGTQIVSLAERGII